MKTARFTSVVAKAGKPKAHLLLTTAARDRTLQSAIRAHRVLSVHQALTGQRKDYGVVGYDAKVASQVLLFPRSLRAFRDARIVGIDYSLLDEPEADVPKNVTPFPVPRASASTGKKAPPSPARKKTKTTPHPSREPEKPKANNPAKPFRKEAPLHREGATREPKSPATGPLKKKLQAVLREWEKGHEVKAHRMLAAVVDGMDG